MKTHSSEKPPYENLYIDLDRTLWDFERNARETFMDIYHKYQLNVYFGGFDNFYDTYKEYNKELWMLYRAGEIDKETLSWKRFDFTLKDIELDDETLARNLAKDYLLLSPTKRKLFPHTNTCLTYLKKQYNLYLITNGFHDVQHRKIINSGLHRYFEDIFTSEDIGTQKPNIEFFNYIIKKTKAKLDTSLVIGDDLEVDIKGAANAGINQVWFNRNYKKTDGSNSNFKPTYEIHSLQELIDIL